MAFLSCKYGIEYIREGIIRVGSIDVMLFILAI